MYRLYSDCSSTPASSPSAFSIGLNPGTDANPLSSRRIIIVPIKGIREKAIQGFKSSKDSLYNDVQCGGIVPRTGLRPNEAWKTERADHRGGEGGIRTRENPFKLYTLSRRACSTAPAPPHDDKKELHRRKAPCRRGNVTSEAFPSMALYGQQCQRMGFRE